MDLWEKGGGRGAGKRGGRGNYCWDVIYRVNKKGQRGRREIS